MRSGRLAIRAVRRAAVDALRKIGDARAVEPLIAALKDTGDPRFPGVPAPGSAVSTLRRAAVDALGQFGDARAVEPLIAALKDDDKDLREAAVDAPTRLGGDRRKMRVVLHIG